VWHEIFTYAQAYKMTPLL